MLRDVLAWSSVSLVNYCVSHLPNLLSYNRPELTERIIHSKKSKICLRVNVILLDIATNFVTLLP